MSGGPVDAASSRLPARWKRICSARSATSEDHRRDYRAVVWDGSRTLTPMVLAKLQWELGQATRLRLENETVKSREVHPVAMRS
jgi:hypothetical protein